MEQDLNLLLLNIHMNKTYEYLQSLLNNDDNSITINNDNIQDNSNFKNKIQSSISSIREV